ncbi:hypothetical protein C0V97_01080 [Asaia sp. W19]|uniref:hypothetical protein n=1 Tax=unclassified Asaia TaxID=2685023 RepID=UPI000F8EE62D|nr:hypothetical protein [Asaia sp. W19]RUT27392.1 hypothetical protein C0V97_01080 [Asaia sp. W19]
MALEADRALVRLMVARGPVFGYAVAAGYVVYRGSITALLSDGTVIPAGVAAPAGLTVVANIGLASQQQNNMANQNVVSPNYGPGPVEIDRGTWALPFDEAPSWANYGASVYAIDDQTVSLSDGSSPASGNTPAVAATRLKIGVLAGFDERGTPFVTI